MGKLALCGDVAADVYLDIRRPALDGAHRQRPRLLGPTGIALVARLAGQLLEFFCGGTGFGDDFLEDGFCGTIIQVSAVAPTVNSHAFRVLQLIPQFLNVAVTVVSS